MLAIITGVTLQAKAWGELPNTAAPASAGATSSETASGPRIIRDMMNRAVEIPEQIDRFALFGGPIGQVAYILGVQDKLCAVSSGQKNSEFLKIMDPRLAEMPAPRQTNGVINLEELIMANPQFVLAGDVDGQIVEKKTRIPVVYFMASSDGNYQATKDEVFFLASVLGNRHKAQAFADYLDRTIALIASRTAGLAEDRRKRVFKGYDSNHLVTYGGDSYMEERIRTAGCRNVASAITTSGKREGLHAGLDQISLEQVLAWDPEIIVIDMGTPEDLYENPQWAGVTAIKQRQVYRQPCGVFVWNRPSAESAVLFTLWLAKIAHPDLFADIDMNAEICRFYREIFAYPLSEEQATGILTGHYSSVISSGMGKRGHGERGNR